MAIGPVVTRGYGPSASIPRVVLAGYNAGVAVYTISGITRDHLGVVLPSCTCHLFRTSDNVYIGQMISDAVTGAYSFSVSSNVVQYFIVAYHASEPLAGTTRQDLTGV